jgi:Domain of unknown function (DUF4251)
MKSLYILGLGLLAMFAITACSSSAQLQDGGDKNIANLIDSKNYVFVAQSVTPTGGRFRSLTTEYDLSVLGDSVVAYLPYFGRAYTAPIDPTQGGIQFTSTNFEYIQTPRKKGGWTISIKPKDAQDVRELTLTASTSGSASLQVISNNRQAISYNGYIQARK